MLKIVSFTANTATFASQFPYPLCVMVELSPFIDKYPAPWEDKIH